MVDQPTEWTEVGERFTALGRTLQGRWGSNRGTAAPAGSSSGPAAGSSSGSSSGSASERDGAAEADAVRSALNKVNASLDELADTITRTVHDPEVHRAATSAAGGLVEALGASLDHLAGRIQNASAGDRADRRTDEQAPGPGPGGASGGQDL